MRFVLARTGTTPCRRGASGVVSRLIQWLPGLSGHHGFVIRVLKVAGSSTTFSFPCGRGHAAAPPAPLAAVPPSAPSPTPSTATVAASVRVFMSLLSLALAL